MLYAIWPWINSLGQVLITLPLWHMAISNWASWNAPSRLSFLYSKLLMPFHFLFPQTRTYFLGCRPFIVWTFRLILSFSSTWSVLGSYFFWRTALKQTSKYMGKCRTKANAVLFSYLTPIFVFINPTTHANSHNSNDPPKSTELEVPQNGIKYLISCDKYIRSIL